MDFSRGEVVGNENIARGQRITNSLSTGEEYAVDFTDDETLFDTLNDKVNVARVGVSKVNHGVASE